MMAIYLFLWCSGGTSSKTHQNGLQRVKSLHKVGTEFFFPNITPNKFPSMFDGRFRKYVPVKSDCDCVVYFGGSFHSLGLVEGVFLLITTFNHHHHHGPPFEKICFVHFCHPHLNKSR